MIFFEYEQVVKLHSSLIERKQKNRRTFNTAFPKVECY